MQRGFAEFLAGLFVDLFGQVLFEGNRLLMMKQLEIAVLVVFLKTRNGLRHPVNRLLALTHSFFQKRKVLVLDSFVIGVVLCMVFISCREITIHVGIETRCYTAFQSPPADHPAGQSFPSDGRRQTGLS